MFWIRSRMWNAADNCHRRNSHPLQICSRRRPKFGDRSNLGASINDLERRFAFCMESKLIWNDCLGRNGGNRGKIQHGNQLRSYEWYFIKKGCVGWKKWKHWSRMTHKIVSTLVVIKLLQEIECSSRSEDILKNWLLLISQGLFSWLLFEGGNIYAGKKSPCRGFPFSSSGTRENMIRKQNRQKNGRNQQKPHVHRKNWLHSYRSWRGYWSAIPPKWPANMTESAVGRRKNSDYIW